MYNLLMGHFFTSLEDFQTHHERIMIHDTTCMLHRTLKDFSHFTRNHHKIIVLIYYLTVI